MRKLCMVLSLLIMSGCVLKVEKLDNVTEVRLVLGDNSTALFDADVSLDDGINLSVSSSFPEQVSGTCQSAMGWVVGVVDFALNWAIKLWPIL